MGVEDKGGESGIVTKAGLMRIRQRQKELLDQINGPAPHPSWVHDPHAAQRVQLRVLAKQNRHYTERLGRTSGQAHDAFNRSNEKENKKRSLARKFDQSPEK